MRAPERFNGSDCPVHRGVIESGRTIIKIRIFVSSIDGIRYVPSRAVPCRVGGELSGNCRPVSSGVVHVIIRVRQHLRRPGGGGGGGVHEI